MKRVYIFNVAVLTVLISVCGCGGKRQKGEPQRLSELDTITFEDLSRNAYQYLNAQQDSCRAKYNILGYERWFYDQSTGKLTFSDSGGPKVVIDYEEVGSVSFRSNTWLWAWANPHLEEKVKSQIGKVRDYGVRRGFEKLTNRKWKADEYDGWEMTSIAAYLLKAKGAYRVPSSDSLLYSFMILKSIRRADTSKNAK